MQVRDVMFNCDVEQVIDELRAQLSINGSCYLQKEPKRSGNSIQVQCPFHGDGMERKPSGGITLVPIRKGNRVIEEGTFHCFACGKICDLPEFISRCFEQDDPMGKFGWQWLTKNFLSLNVEERKDIDLDFGRNHKHKKQEPTYITEEELDKYRYYHPYWGKRGITNDNIIELFDLGFENDTQCITFPVRDIQGNCLFVAKRSVKTKWFNYPEGVEKPLYGLYELNATTLVNGHKVHILPSFPKEIIVCESMIDALTCWQYGKYAVALNGTGNDLQFKQLSELPCRELVLATDNDEAGRKARQRIRQNVHNKIITEYILPEGKKDINELTEEEFYSMEKIF